MKNEIWAEKYRPQKVEDCILPDFLINQFKAFLREGVIPNLILVGPSGVGKTTIALALLKEYGCDYIKINSSLKKGIDMIREEVMQFASTVSFADKKKYVVFDEADGMLNNAQDSLKSFIEEFSDNCGFIFTCNNVDRINKAIQSRCQIINFTFEKKDLAILGREFLNRLNFIFSEEKVEYDLKTVGIIIKKYFPDWRKILILLQNYYILCGKIDTGLLANKEFESYQELIDLIKHKSWDEMRRWVGENTHAFVDFTQFAKPFIKQLEKQINPISVPVVIMRYNEFDFQNYFVVDKENNVVAFLTKLMNEISFK